MQRAGVCVYAYDALNTELAVLLGSSITLPAFVGRKVEVSDNKQYNLLQQFTHRPSSKQAVTSVSLMSRTVKLLCQVDSMLQKQSKTRKQRQKQCKYHLNKTKTTKAETV